MSIISWDVTEADEHLHDRWLQGFCIQVPDKEILEHVRVTVDFEEGVAVLLVCRHCFVPAVLVELADRLEEQLHLVEDKDDVTHLLVLGDLRFEGFVPHVFLCHNFEFLALIIVVVTANI